MVEPLSHPFHQSSGELPLQTWFLYRTHDQLLHAQRYSPSTNYDHLQRDRAVEAPC